MDANTPIDQMIGAFWDLCDDGDGWDFRAAVDQWWWFGARCAHHPWQGQPPGVPWAQRTWHAVSNGSIDLSTAILGAYEQAVAAHKDR